MLKPMSPAPGFPAPMFGRPLKGGAGRVQDFRMDAAGQDSQNRTSEVERYLRSCTEMDIVTGDGKTVTVLVRRQGVSDSSETGTRAPWEITKIDGRVVRIYPSAIWDGKGNSVWATYQGNPSIAESSFDFELARLPSQGFIWVECATIDTDDYHGIIDSAAIKHGASPGFLTKQGSLVNIPLCSYFVSVSGLSVTIDPVTPFVFSLRRFGPPTSITWDITPR